jgi:hypothetical protein
VCLYRLFPSLIDASIVFKPETLLRWHRRAFRLFWRRKSRRRAGRPLVSSDVRSLVQRISRGIPLWDAPRIHGELLKLSIEIARSFVAKYMPGRPAVTRLEDLPSQSRARHRRGRPLVLPTIGLQAALWISDHRSRATSPGLDQRDHQPDCRVDCSAEHRSNRPPNFQHAFRINFSPCANGQP